jgi:NAD(P)-dependent dehydrogenase (short-subunit alcohol dehydrogenase family)
MSKTVFITGASRGIGEATALGLSADGYTVFVGVRSEMNAEALRVKSNGKIYPVMLDVTNPQQIEDSVKLLSRTLAETGLYALVNNAGIVTAGPLECIGIEQFKRQIDVNVSGVLAVTQAMLPLLRIARGRILNIGSAMGRIATPFVGAYSASKYAMRAITQTLRMELRPANVKVSLIEPGRVKTPILETSLKAANALTDGSLQPYKTHMDRTVLLAEYGAKMASEIEAVVNAIRRALLAKHPGHTYVVGIDAKMCRVLEAILPHGIYESVVCSLFQLK